MPLDQNGHRVHRTYRLIASLTGAALAVAALAGCGQGHTDGPDGPQATEHSDQGSAHSSAGPRAYDPDAAAKEFVTDLAATGIATDPAAIFDPAFASKIDKAGFTLKRHGDGASLTQEKTDCGVVFTGSGEPELTCGEKTFTVEEYAKLFLAAANPASAAADRVAHQAAKTWQATSAADQTPYGDLDYDALVKNLTSDLPDAKYIYTTAPAEGVMSSIQQLEVQFGGCSVTVTANSAEVGTEPDVSAAACAID